MLNPKSFKYMHLLTETRKPVMFCIAYLLQKEQARIVQMADFSLHFVPCSVTLAGQVMGTSVVQTQTLMVTLMHLFHALTMTNTAERYIH